MTNNMTHEHTVLIIEDDLVIVPWFLEVLKYAFDTVVATTLNQARRILNERHIAAILMDLVLPNGQGKELVELFCQEFPEVPIVCISAYDYTADELIAAGAHDFIKKPGTEHEILDKITNTIARHKAQKRLASFVH